MEFSERLRELKTKRKEIQAVAAIEITSRQYRGIEIGTDVSHFRNLCSLANRGRGTPDYPAGRSDVR